MSMHFRNMFENACDAMFIIELDSKIIVAANKAANKLTLLQNESLIGSELHKKNQDLIEFRIQDSNEIFDPFEGEFIDAGGKKVPVEVLTTKMIFQEKECLVGTLRNIERYKQKEEELNSALQHLQFHVENTPLAMVEFNNEKKITRWSEKAEKLFGWTEAEVINKKIEEIKWIHEEDLEEASLLLAEMMSGRLTSNIHINRNYRKDGTDVTCEWYNSVLTDSSGRTISIHSFIQDITNRKNNEKLIKKLSMAVECSKASIVITDCQGRIEYANPYFSKLTGYSSEEYYGKNPRFLKTEHHNPEYYQNLWQTILSGKPWEGEFLNRKKNGDLYWEHAIISPIANEKNEITHFVGVKTDITENKRINTELIYARDRAEKSEELYKMFIEYSLDGIYRLEVNPPADIKKPPEELIDYIYDHACIVEWNKAFMEMYDVTDPNDLVNKKLIDFHGGNSDPQNREQLRKFVSNGFQIKNELTKERDQIGNLIYFSNSTVGIIENGLLTRMWGTQLDVTEEQKYKIELIQSREKAEAASRLKTAFLQNMSHEIRTPLNAIVGFSSIIAHRTQDDQKLRDFSKLISFSSDKLLGIITDVIEISKAQTSLLEIDCTEIYLAELISKVTDPFYDKAKSAGTDLVLIKKNIVAETTIRTDYLKLEKIIFHLVDNAVKFTKQGSVIITFEIVSDNLKVVVSDTGIGIAKKDQEYIFEPFRQVETESHRNYGGLGLGLSLLKAYVDLLKGHLVFESEIGKGTTITIEIPAEEIYRTEKLENPPENKTDVIETVFTQKTILIAEDDRYNFLFLREALQLEDYIVLHACNGKLAVEMCISNYDISLVLMDFKMPVMDGGTAARLIKQIRPDLPIIAQTAYLNHSDHQIMFKDFDEIMNKPVRLDELKSKISKFMIS